MKTGKNMIVGMTGFGRAQCQYKQLQLNLQIRSVNHRFCEVVFHIPENFICLEGRIKKYIQKYVKRGRVTVNLSIHGNLDAKVIIDQELARRYFRSLRNLKKTLNLSGEISLAQLSNFPGVLGLREVGLSDKMVWPAVEKLLRSACSDLRAMRLKEGRAVSKDMLSRASKIHKKLLFVKRRTPVVIAAKRRRIKEIAGNIEEISGIIKACDISEEVMRLGFHLKNFAAKVYSNRHHNPIGKELDFIAQEMQREANTMGAKCQDALLGAAVIEIKSQVEKIREQVQNVE